ncbi:MAG: hypothetical protein GF334_10610 [Candidatus Altiarchaeales archaeon]|nr:hypothetical protein [Candidatus Altiarchaeales archaeon]
MTDPVFLWCLTGASHMLGECVEAFKQAEASLDVAETPAGRQVLEYLGLSEQVKGFSRKIYLQQDVGPHPMLVTKLSLYKKIFIAPATANTIAKIRYGIADSLATNIAAQAVKRNLTPVILPTDAEKKISTRWGCGETEITARSVDLENLSTVRESGEFKVIESPDQLRQELKLG